MKLSIQLVTWNGAKYIPYLFKSLREQTFKDYFLHILDNGSSDQTIELIEKELNSLNALGELIKNEENLGFANGHNLLYRATLNIQHEIGEYVLLLNQDMFLKPDCLEKLINFLDNNSQAAVVSPRLMRWDFNKLQVLNCDLPDSFTEQIDSLGLQVFRNRRVAEIETGERWLQEIGAREVFGVSGALPMFRRPCLEAVKFADGAIFDSLYHSYKEDVDLAYRLQLAGFKNYVLLEALAYHDRSGAGPKNASDLSALKNKQTQSDLIKYHSYKNHLMTLYKNEFWQNFLLDFPCILWYELKKFIYFLFFERGALSGLSYIWRHKKELKEKRIFIKNQRKISWREMRKQMLR